MVENIFAFISVLLFYAVMFRSRVPWAIIKTVHLLRAEIYCLFTIFNRIGTCCFNIICLSAIFSHEIHFFWVNEWVGLLSKLHLQSIKSFSTLSYHTTSIRRPLPKRSPVIQIGYQLIMLCAFFSKTSSIE